jgi:prepilin-type N-terminal cleavage/methylation domain-containing protein
MFKKTTPCFKKGFTLAELLICLAILGEISAFTIPKIINSQQNTQSNAIAKEAAGTVSSALLRYQIANSLTNSTNCSNLMPYINYVAQDTSTIIDSESGGTSLDCSTAGTACYRLHNGAMLWNGSTNVDFGGTSTLNAIYFLVDPDGKYSGSTTGPSKSLKIYLYTTGRVATWASITSGTITHEWGSWYTTNPDATRDPSWFSWN